VGVSRYPLLSQERVKLRTSNFVGTFIGLIGTKAHENVGNSAVGVVRESQGVPKMFRASICRETVKRILRGHLCDSTAFLFNFYLRMFVCSVVVTEKCFH